MTKTRNDPPPAQRTNDAAAALVIAFAGEVTHLSLSLISPFQKKSTNFFERQRESRRGSPRKWVFVGRGPKWTRTSQRRRRTTTTEEEEGESSEDASLLERSKLTTFLTVIQLFKLLIALLVLASASFRSLFLFVCLFKFNNLLWFILFYFLKKRWTPVSIV